MITIEHHPNGSNCVLRDWMYVMNPTVSAYTRGHLKPRYPVPTTQKTGSWDHCEHTWKLSSRDWDLPDDREEVTCVKCGCPGERDSKTGNVHWPAT